MSRLTPLRRRWSASLVVLVATMAITALSVAMEVRNQGREVEEERTYELREVQEGLSSLHRDLQMVNLLGSHHDEGKDDAVSDYLAARRDELLPVRWLGFVPLSAGRTDMLLASADARGFDPRNDPAIAAAMAHLGENEVRAVRPATHRTLASLALLVGPPENGGAILVALVDGDDLLAASMRAMLHPTMPFILMWGDKRIGQWPASPLPAGEPPVATMTTAMASQEFTLAFSNASWSARLARISPLPLTVLLAGLAVAAALRTAPRHASPAAPNAVLATSRSHRARLWTLGDMAAALSHDLGQPLNVIRLTAESSLDAVSQGRMDGERLRRGLNNVVEQVLRAQDMVDALVAASRRPTLPASPLRPVEAVRRTLAQGLPVLRAGNIRLRWHADLSTPPVNGHPHRLEAALRQLLLNAANALAARRLDLGTVGTIRVECRPHDDAVAITIADDGPGFPPALKAALETETAESRGKGLGLTIALGVVAEMGGTLSIVDAQPGTRVTLTLPAARRSLLLVDDDVAAINELAEFLRSKGWQVRTAGSGNAAMALFSQHRPDALITDLHMPDGDGWQLIEQVRARAPDLPIIAISTADGDETRRAVAAGAALVMRKPVGLSDLSAELNSLFYGEW